MNTGGFTAGARRAQSTTATLSASMRTIGADTGKATSGISLLGAGLAGLAAGAGMAAINTLKNTLRDAANAAVDFATASVKLAADMEVNTVAFTTLLGSADAAHKMLAQLQQFAATTPFEFTELVSATRRLMALGFEAEQTLPLLRVVGDAAGALGLGSEGIDRITLALGQMQSKGKVSAQEINQLAEAGIPAWQAIADAIGVSIPEAMKMAENGAISAGVGINAIVASMNERFGGGMAAQAQTVTGVWSNLKDTVVMQMTEIGQAIIAGFDLKLAIATITQMASTFKTDWLPTISAAIQYVGQVFGSVIGFISDLWNNWLGASVFTIVQMIYNDFASKVQLMGAVWQFFVGASIGDLADLAKNADLYVAIMAEKFVLFAQNSASQLWALIQTAGDFAAYLGQLAIGNVFADMPGMAKAAVAETTPVLDGLYAELGKRQAAKPLALPQAQKFDPGEFKPLQDAFAVAANDGVVAGVVESLKSPEIAQEATTAESASTKKASTATAAVSFGSREALSAAARIANSSKDPAVKATEKVEKAIKELPEKIAEAVPAFAGGEFALVGF